MTVALDMLRRSKRDTGELFRLLSLGLSRERPPQ
jgi:hypothetical protein